MPPTWVKDEDKWEEAKKAAGTPKSKYKRDPRTFTERHIGDPKYPEESAYWATVTHIYKNMGGRIESKEKKAMSLADRLRKAAKTAGVKTAAFKMTPKDKKVVDCFLDKKPCNGKKLTTDGERLDGMWMGGNGIAVWKGSKIDMPDLGSKAAQTVQNFVRKKAPKNWIGASVEKKAWGAKYDIDYEVDDVRDRVRELIEFRVEEIADDGADELERWSDDLFSVTDKSGYGDEPESIELTWVVEVEEDALRDMDIDPDDEDEVFDRVERTVHDILGSNVTIDRTGDMEYTVYYE